MNFSKPKLPRALLHTLTAIRYKFERDTVYVGRSWPADETTITFNGIVMPLSNEDWKLLPEGSYTQNSQKLYTDDTVDIQPGDIIQDSYDGQRYTVKTKLAHNSIHPMTRYIVEGVVHNDDYTSD